MAEIADHTGIDYIQVRLNCQTGVHLESSAKFAPKTGPIYNSITKIETNNLDESKICYILYVDVFVNHRLQDRPASWHGADDPAQTSQLKYPPP